MCVRSVRIENTNILDLIICNGRRYANVSSMEALANCYEIIDTYGCIMSTKSATIPNSVTSSRNDLKAAVEGEGDE
jgi:hypothetical protein